MNRVLAFLWLAVVAIAAGYLAMRIHDGLSFRTDLLALIPREDRDPVLQRANDQVTEALSRRVLILIGDRDRDAAHAAARHVAGKLADSGLMTVESTGFDQNRLRRMGELYFPYRRGLLAPDDRTRLREGREEDVATRALSQVYGVLGMADAKLLQSDPFLLLPAFMASLPMPLSRLGLDDGLLTTRVDDITWGLVAGRLRDSPYALETQSRLSEILDGALQAQRATAPALEMLRLGAVFFAKAGAEQAMNETSTIGMAATLGSVLLTLLVFRAAGPLWMTVLAMAAGIATALAASLWIFGELHVLALLFGVGLIGIAVDYSLQYFSEIFAPERGSPTERLARVLPGMTVGVVSVTVGYLTLFLAPFPGLHQIAAFSAIGLLASWITVVLWLPPLDRSKPPRHGRHMLAWAAGLWDFWRAPSHRPWRFAAVGATIVLTLVGLSRLHADDDVRRMQSLDPTLLAEQVRIQRIIGSTAGTQYFLVQAPDEETALRREEELIARLQPLVAHGALSGFQALAQYVPSAATQGENRNLQARLEGALLTRYAGQLGLPLSARPLQDEDSVLTPAEAAKESGPFGFLSLLRLEGSTGQTIHVVPLEGITDLAAVGAAAAGLPDVRLVDPARDFSALLGKYRNRAVILLAAALLLMTPLLLWRYGPRGAVQVVLPALLAMVVTPALRALSGEGFTFFDAMALVLVLSIGIDYAVFVAETMHERKDVTLLAVALAALSTLLSFGLLAWSDAHAVHAFGATMLLGVTLVFLFVPLAAADRRR